MSVRDLLAARSAALAPRAEFTLVGEPALLVTNESTPRGFYDELRRVARLDGYVVGPGCGNVLAMVEGFTAAARGLVLVDVDPAVVCAGRMLVACVARHERLEDFVREFFCTGEAALAGLEQEVLAEADTPDQRRRLEREHARVWKGLEVVTEGFRYRPEDAGAWLRKWQGFDSTATGSAGGVPVRTLMAKNHGLLHSLARRGDIAVAEASLFDPVLLAAVADLPGFAQARNLVYLSNAADHVLRRAVFAAAKARLRLGPQVADGPHPRSVAEFLAYVNDGHLARLHAVAGGERRTRFVYCTTRNELTLCSTAEVPRYREGDLELGADLEQALRGFFGPAAVGRAGYAAAAVADRNAARHAAAAGEEWEGAAGLRELAFGLYRAVVAGDRGEVAAALGDLAADRTWQALPAAAAAGSPCARRNGAESGPPRTAAAMSYLAFWTAELAYALLAAADGGHDHGALWTATLGKLGRAASWLCDHAASPASPAPSPAGWLLCLARAEALVLSGRLLRLEPLVTAGLEALRQIALPGAGDAAAAGGTDRGEGGEGGAAAGGGWEAEALLRLVSVHAHLPLRHWDETMAELARRLRRTIARSGQLAPARPGTEAAEPYLAFATRPEVMVDAGRWALLLYGLLSEEMEPIVSALLLTYHARFGAATLETHVLFDRLMADVEAAS